MHSSIDIYLKNMYVIAKTSKRSLKWAVKVHTNQQKLSTHSLMKEQP